jgi:hypothetical protein
MASNARIFIRNSEPERGVHQSQMTRKTFLETSLLLGTKPGRALIASGAALAQRAAADDPPLVLRNSNHALGFNKSTGQLLSFEADGQQFVSAAPKDPVFVIQYLDQTDEFQQLDSTKSKSISARVTEDGNASVLTAAFSGIGGVELDATVTVRQSADSPLSRWSITISNRAGLRITDVQFPFVVVRYNLGGGEGSEQMLIPSVAGRLLVAPQPQDLEPDSPHAWQFRPENGDASHYPGMPFAQFLAYWNDHAGIFINCEDTGGAIKLIKPLHHKDGIRLGVAHVGDWPIGGRRQLEYDVVLRSFKGDWYDAAKIYRDWSLQQHWAQKPLHKRTDVPKWLLDSPPHIIVRIQGQLDIGPADPNTEFLPYPKVIPLLESVSRAVNSPVVPVIMSWERPGPWIYPDCFPPAGGEESLREFTQMARARGWHIGSFCNGTRWVVGHYWSGYDGRKYFREHNGARTVCRTHSQQMWPEGWDQSWRPSYPTCMGVAETREIALKFMDTLTNSGLDWVQFFDQNVGGATFPCYSKQHGHPAMPGKWMNLGMRNTLDSFHEVAAQLRSKSNRELVLSVEQAPNEFVMPHFQICDIRVVPTGHSGPPGSGAGLRDFIPLYHFLYHEFILMQGGFGFGPEPYHLPIRNAYNLVVGEIPGAVLTGEGKLLNRDTINWAPWLPQVGSNEDALEVLRTGTALRRGPAKRFLVFGRMQRPATADGVKTVKWEREREIHEIPAVYHSAWQSPSGQFGLICANWTTDSQGFELKHEQLGTRVTESISSKELKSRDREVTGNAIRVTLPPLSCGLIES